LHRLQEAEYFSCIASREWPKIMGVFVKQICKQSFIRIATPGFLPGKVPYSREKKRDAI